MRKAAVVFCLIVVLCVAPAVLAGDLTPPGAPASTMKTLDEVEARTPISSIPYTINASGSYYLTQDVGPAGQDTDGILISADNVTLDLNGFSVIGPGIDQGSSGDGIDDDGTRKSIVVRNGTVRDWRGYGITLGSATGGECSDLRVHNNGSDGLFAGTGFSVLNNAVFSNNAAGIRTNAGCMVSGNTCYDNGSYGITASSGSTVTGNACYDNAGSGLFASGGTVTNNSCRSNDDDGIHAYGGCTVSDNACSFNKNDGIYVRSDCLVFNNTCHSNGFGTGGDGAGIFIGSSETDNSIERNLVTGNDRGIDVDGTGNYIAGNRASGNTTDYDIVGGNTEGAGDLANVAF